jgi:hypothetical protein
MAPIRDGRRRPSELETMLAAADAERESAAPDGASGHGASMRSLQQSAGNAAVARRVIGASRSQDLQRAPAAPAVRQGEPAHGEGGEGEHGEAAEGRVPFAGVAFEREFTLFETEPKPFGPVMVGASGKVKLAGEMKHGEGPVAKFGAKGRGGFDETGIEDEFKTKYGSVKVGGQLEPGKVSSIQVGFATETFEVSFEAKASLKDPFALKCEIHLEKTKLEFGGWEFAGQVDGVVEIGIGPNWVVLGEYAAGAAAGGGAAGEGVSVMALGSGTAGSLAVGASIAAAAVAWEGLVLYEIGAANIEGERRAVRNNYINGYARTLAAITANRAAIQAVVPADATEEEKQDAVEAANQKFVGYISVNWAGQLAAAEKAYLSADSARERDNARFDADEAGCAHAWQQAMAFVGQRGAAGMKELKASHQSKYGRDEPTRRQAYHDILHAAPLDGPPPTVPLG